MAGRYVIAQGDAGAKRLEKLAEATWPASYDFLVSQGIGAGQHCLEVGCAAGAVSERLLSVVGSAGSVTGLDIDPESVAIAQKRLSHHSNARFHAIDIETANAFDLPGQYDLIYCRFLLKHLKDPLALLQKLKPLLSPTGQLVAQDMAEDSSCYPDSVAFYTLVSALKQVFRSRECYSDLANVLPKLYNDCHLKVSRLHAVRLQPSNLTKEIFLQTLYDMKDAIVQEQVLSSNTFDVMHKSLTAFFNEPYTFYFIPTQIIIAGKA
ncbi:methyltransferase [Candidatus Sororendozoicomonas aggregata]|uniref:methyltransferase n=1 Tax=Candidatus Sororendozoicomonas aggregata TaxID=3073239 RepID=UPI002ED649A5